MLKRSSSVGIVVRRRRRRGRRRRASSSSLSTAIVIVSGSPARRRRRRRSCSQNTRNARSYRSWSSGRRTSVDRAGPVDVVAPLDAERRRAPRRRTRRRSPARPARRRAARGRRRRPSPRAWSRGPPSSARVSARARQRLLDDVGHAVLVDALVVLAVLEDGAERRLDGVLVELADAEAAERGGPVDRLGDARRLVQRQLAQRGDGGGDLAGERLADLRAPAAARWRPRGRSRGARPSGTGSAA